MATNQKKNELKNNGRRKISSNGGGGGGIIVLGGALLTAAISAAFVSHIAKRNTQTKSRKHKINNKEMGLHSLLPSADQSEKLGVEESEIQVTSSKDYDIIEEIREIEDGCKLSEIITERAQENDISNSEAIEARENESCVEESDVSHLGEIEQSTSIAEISRKEMDSTDINMQDNETTENLVKPIEEEENANEEEMKSRVDSEEGEIDGEEICPTELVETETDLVPIQANDFSNSEAIKTRESELCDAENVVEESDVFHLEGEVEQPTSITEIPEKETYSTNINMPDNEAIENLAKAAEVAENANGEEMKAYGDDEEREIDREEVCPTDLVEIKTNLLPIQGNNFNYYETIDARESEEFNAENVVEESGVPHLKEVKLPICMEELVFVDGSERNQENDFSNSKAIETRESESCNVESVVEELDVSYVKEVEQPTSIVEIPIKEMDSTKINMSSNEAAENLVMVTETKENVNEEEKKFHVDNEKREIDCEEICPAELVEIETDLVLIQENDLNDSEVIKTRDSESCNAKSVVEDSDVSHLEGEIEQPTSIAEVPRKETDSTKINMPDNEVTENLVNANEEEMKSHVTDEESEIDSEVVCPTELVKIETDLVAIQNIKLEIEDIQPMPTIVLATIEESKASLVEEKEESKTESTKLEEKTSDSFMEMNAEAIYKLSSTEKEMKLESETMGKTNDILKTKSDTMVACKESRKDFMLISSPKAFLMVLALALFAGLLALFHHEQIGQHNNSVPKIYHQLYQLLFRSYN